MVQLMAKLGMGRLPVLTDLALSVMPVGNAGSSALGAAAGPRRPAAAQGPRTVRRRHRQRGLVCPRTGLAKASRAGGYWSFVQPVRRRGRRRPPGAAARARQAGALSPPPAAGPGALSPPTVGLAKLVVLIVDCTLIADAGCAALISALDSGALPALEHLTLGDTRDSPTSPTAVAAVGAALANQVSVLRAKGARGPPGRKRKRPSLYTPSQRRPSSQSHARWLAPQTSVTPKPRFGRSW